MWLRAIASTTGGARDDAQTAGKHAQPPAGAGIRLAAGYTASRIHRFGADGAYLRKTGLQPGLSHF